VKGIISKTLAATAICATALIGAGATPALAGEVTGNYTVTEGLDGETVVLKGKLWTPKGASECSFSGQNDGFHDPALADGGPVDAATRTQTPGGAIRSGMPGRLVGMFCNPTFSFPD
jgi:hypothetical protein